MSINPEKYNIKLTNFNKSQDDILKFDVINANSAFVNTLRRIIISHVKTISFDTTDYENSDLKIIDNTSSFHNEFLLHRMGLIPIYSENIDIYDESLYKFILKVKNDTDSIIDVTTKDIVVMNIKTNVPEDTSKFFKQNEITGDHILITKLKTNPDKNGEEIHIEVWRYSIIHVKHHGSTLCSCMRHSKEEMTNAFGRLRASRWVCPSGAFPTGVLCVPHKFN